MNEKEEMKSDMTRHLACLLMKQRPNLDMEQALSLVFNSETYQKVLEDETRLYYQSPKYVFSYLRHELETGKIG